MNFMIRDLYKYGVNITYCFKFLQCLDLESSVLYCALDHHSEVKGLQGQGWTVRNECPQVSTWCCVVQRSRNKSIALVRSQEAVCHIMKNSALTKRMQLAQTVSGVLLLPVQETGHDGMNDDKMSNVQKGTVNIQMYLEVDS